MISMAFKSRKANHGARIALVLAALALVCWLDPAGITALADSTRPALWPHQKSDLKPDPAIRYGSLPNGFRYALMQNQEPRDRVSVHLAVQAGSLHETDDQQGLAHFLEHMLFNGSTHFKPGELVQYFQDIGMQFGADANAHTGFDETVYDILLPDGSRESLAKALLVLQDYAQGALLLPAEIEGERGVVLSELRSRDSVSYRTFRAALKFEFPQARLSRRLPIGQKTVIENADRTQLKAFYDDWYRPENMILVMVGDFDADLVVELIEEKFAPLTARAAARPQPQFGRIDHHGIKPFYLFEAEAGHTTVGIEVVRAVAPEPDSVAYQQAIITEEIAHRMVQNRLERLLRQPDTPFTAASISAGRFLERVAMAEISAECDPQNWDRSLTLIEQTLRQALVHGFTAEELDRVRKDIQAELDNAVKKAATRQSQHLARRIIQHLNADRVLQSPLQERQLFGPFLSDLTTAQVSTAFRRLWDADHRLVMVSGNVDLNPAAATAEETIQSVYLASGQVAIGEAPPNRAVRFPYLPDPRTGGTIVARRYLADLDVSQIDFDNGLRLNLKVTDFKADEVLVNLAFGAGRASQPPGQSGLADLSQEVVNESGLGSLTREELARGLAGKSTGIAFGVEEDHFVYNGRTVAGEIDLLFQLLWTHVVDPGWRQDAFELVMERFRQKYLTLERSVNGAMTLAGRRFLAGGDGRFGLPAFERFNQLTLADVRAWIEPALSQAPLEISVVGEFEPSAVIAAVSKFFGTLAPRQARSDGVPGEPIGFPAGKTLQLEVPTQIPKGLVVTAFPTADAWDIRRVRRLAVLAEVFSERLRQEVRERLGAAYSPFAYNRSTRAYPGYGVLQAVIQVAPDQVDAIGAEVQKITAELAARPIAADELERVLGPTRTTLKDMRRQNSYWLDRVLTLSSRHPIQLQWSRSIMTDYTAITAAEIFALAQQYLDIRNMARIMVIPE